MADWSGQTLSPDLAWPLAPLETLATVQRCILRYRGSVFADGVPDQDVTSGSSLPNLPRA